MKLLTLAVAELAAEIRHGVHTGAIPEATVRSVDDADYFALAPPYIAVDAPSIMTVTGALAGSVARAQIDARIRVAAGRGNDGPRLLALTDGVISHLHAAGFPIATVLPIVDAAAPAPAPIYAVTVSLSVQDR